MQLTVLGKSPAWSDAGGACSGYLVEEGGTRVLLDCGNGVFGKLRAHADYLDVAAVIVSHLHADHVLDLVPFAYGLTYSPRRGPDSPAPVLHAPSGARDFFRRVCGAWGGEQLVETAFALSEYEPEDTLEVGPVTVAFHEVPHFVRTHAVRLESDGRRLTYGADHGPSDALVDFAADSDLLVLEATIPEPEPEPPRGHITPREAGEHARRAGARRLLLTHVTDELDADAIVAEARAAFGGPVQLAREGLVVQI